MQTIIDGNRTFNDITAEGNELILPPPSFSLETETNADAIFSEEESEEDFSDDDVTLFNSSYLDELYISSTEGNELILPPPSFSLETKTNADAIFSEEESEEDFLIDGNRTFNDITAEDSEFYNDSYVQDLLNKSLSQLAPAPFYPSLMITLGLITAGVALAFIFFPAITVAAAAIRTTAVAAAVGTTAAVSSLTGATAAFFSIKSSPADRDKLIGTLDESKSNNSPAIT